MRIGPAQQHGRHALDIRRQPRRVQGADMLADRHQHLAAKVPAFLLGRELVLEMHARRTRLDHRPHQLIRVQRPAEPGFRIGDDRRHPVRPVGALAASDLIGPAQRRVDPLHHHRHRGPPDTATGPDTSVRPNWHPPPPASPTGRSPATRPSPAATPGFRSTPPASAHRVRCAADARAAPPPSPPMCAGSRNEPASRSTSAAL